MTCSAQEFFRDLGSARSSGGFGPVASSEYTYRDSAPMGLGTDTGPSVTPTSATLTGTPFSSLSDNPSENYNFAITGFRFSIAAGIGIEFNDNITLSDHNRQSDIIIRPSLEIDGVLPISDLNTLRLSLGISYAKYFNHSQYDTSGVLISPSSELELKMIAGPVNIRVRDRLSYQEDSYDVPDLNNVARYRRWENQAGFVADWDVNADFTLTAGYDHYNLWTQGSGIFSDQDRAIDTIFLKPAYKLAPGLRAGLDASYSFITFTQGDRPNGHNILVGPFIDWQITKNTDIYVEGGFQSLHFNGATHLNSTLLSEFGSANGLSSAQVSALDSQGADNSSTDSVYFKAEIDNKASDVFQQRLMASKTSEIGFFTNSYDLYHVEYTADYTGIAETEISPTLFYEYLDSSGPEGEKANRFGAGIGARRYLTKSITAGLDYRFLWKGSNIPGANYYQNLVFLSLYYKF